MLIIFLSPFHFVLIGRVKLEERPNIAERRLVYFPKNAILGNLTKLAADKLKLQGIDGVNTTEALADAMLYRQVFACIEFKHDVVSVLANERCFAFEEADRMNVFRI